MLKHLDKVVDSFMASGWADSTKRTYKAQLKCYLSFCQEISQAPYPVDEHIVCQYIAYLASVKHFKFGTIENYINIIKHLHKCNNLEDPVKSSWLVHHVLVGAK